LTDHLSYESEFLSGVNIGIVFSNNPQYKELKPLFDEYGYGFMVPNKNMIVIDGDVILEYGSEVLKFIEAHEVSHVILGHGGPRNPQDEIEADLGAYILLKKFKKLKSIPYLISNFEDRHGISFDEKKTEGLKKYFQ
jgi:hypothetical protein